MRDRSVIVGVTCHAPRSANGEPRRVNLRRTVIDAIVRAGGTPLLLPPVASQAGAHAAICAAFVFTGGDDPRTEEFDPRVPTHPRATVMDQDRQAHETALLRFLRDEAPDKPVLGICLGMQLMALVAGGELNQCLEDDTATHGDHAPPREKPDGDQVHSIIAEHALLASGEVNSWHRQAVRAPGPAPGPGSMRIVARAHDGVIEAIDDPSRAFYLGVQWHPERFDDVGLDQSGPLADGLFRAMVAAARR
jgi:putative glutamine amidotransferase